MGYFDKFKKVVENAVKTGEALGKQASQKARKPFRQYMAPERAQKVLEKQREIPNRAPMNVPKINFSKERILENKEKVKEILQKSDELIKKIDKMKIVSHAAPGEVDARESVHPKPQARTITSPPVEEVKKGLIPLHEMIELLHNFQIHPDEWTAKELADRFQLRESDVKDLLDNFQLIQPDDRIINR